MPSLQWTSVARTGIELAAADVYHGGRVVDVVFTGTSMLAAAERSGVWLVAMGGEAAGLSVAWANTDVQTLSPGVTPTHYYAGCSLEYFADTSELLYETNRAASTPLAAPWRAIRVPGGITQIWDIVVIGARIVLATDRGIYWSPVPPPGGAYAWAAADGTAGTAFFSLCRSSGGKVLAGAFGAKPIHVGRWLLASPTDPTVSLSFEPAKVPAPVAAVMRRTTVDACRKGGYARAYALGFAGDGTPSTLAVSNDGGLTWAAAKGKLAYPTAPKLSGPALISNTLLTGDGTAGGTIHRVTVSAVEPDLVAFGNIHGYFSRNRGDDFEPIGGWPELGGIEPQLHDDVHVVAFDPGDPTGRRVVLASDGGLAATTLPTQSPSFWTFTDYNRRLNNHQLYSTNAYARTFTGCFGVTASSSSPGLVVAGVQDNGNIYVELSGSTPTWQRVDGGDGARCFFIDPLELVRADTGKTPSDIWHSRWFSATGEFDPPDTIPLLAYDGTKIASSVPGIRLSPVVDPAFSDKKGRLMYAVGCLGTTVYGLFADASGANPAFVPVAAWPAEDGEDLGAVASYDGLWIVGIGNAKDGARIFLIIPKVAAISAGKLGGLGRQLANQLPVDHTGGGVNKYVTLIRAADARTYYAMYSDRSGNRRSGAILRTIDRGEDWERLGTAATGKLPDELFFGLAVDRRYSPFRVIAATDRHVYLSTDAGDHWTNVSGGLPACPHNSHLELHPLGGVAGADVYLGTYGWGLWRARLT